MSAGDGYRYLLRSVAIGDGQRSLATPLTRYYTEMGCPPGRWLGSGLAALGSATPPQGVATARATTDTYMQQDDVAPEAGIGRAAPLAPDAPVALTPAPAPVPVRPAPVPAPMPGPASLVVGDVVTELGLQRLMGASCDPVTGTPPGRGHYRYRPAQERIATRVGRLDPALPATERADAVAAITAVEQARKTRKPVAGYDYTFSVPKSVSALWAVADAGTQELLVAAHLAARAQVVDFMEREVVATRIGVSVKTGPVLQAEVAGVIAAAFDHWDSRAGDPQLHTHVVISNRVHTVADGR